MMETKKHWKIVSAGIWLAGLTIAMLVSLVQAKEGPVEEKTSS